MNTESQTPIEASEASPSEQGSDRKRDALALLAALTLIGIIGVKYYWREIGGLLENLWSMFRS